MDGKEWLQSITHAEPVAYGSALLPLLASAAIKARVIKGEESRGTLMVVHPFLAAAFSSRGSATARDEGQAGLYTLLECCFFCRMPEGTAGQPNAQNVQTYPTRW